MSKTLPQQPAQTPQAEALKEVQKAANAQAEAPLAKPGETPEAASDRLYNEQIALGQAYVDTTLRNSKERAVQIGKSEGIQVT